MVRYVYTSPGVTEQVQNVFPGQPKRHEDGSEWGESFTENLQPIDIRFLKVLGGQGGTKYSVLSNAYYVI